MDAKKKQALIDTLSDKKNFERHYSAENRRWFVDKLIRVFIDQHLSDSQIEAKLPDVIQKATKIAHDQRDFKTSLALNSDRKKTERSFRTRRVEVIYGAIGTHPDFVDPANKNYLDFIIRRRYRPLLRMGLFVNPNSLGYFRYPVTCESNKDWRVNKDAQPFWVRKDAKNVVPIIFKDAGTDETTAIEKIYTPKSKACDGNLFDCATTLGIQFMDSLFEAKDPVNLFVDIQSPDRTYLAIVHVRIGFHFITDTSANGLFTQGDALVEDLQVGDHVYIYNHPLYKVFHPFGSWRGEHSLMVECGDRKVSSKKGFRFTGHGLSVAGGKHEGSVYDFYAGLFKDLLTDLSRVYEIGKIFLSYLDSGETNIPTSKVTKQDKTLKVGAQDTDFTLYQVTKDFKYRDYHIIPTGSKRMPTKPGSQFVIARFKSLDGFYVCREGTIADVLARQNMLDPTGPGETTPPPTFIYDGAGGATGKFDPVHWNIGYNDPTTGNTVFFDLYQKKAGKLVMHEIKIADLVGSAFAKSDPSSSNVFTTRPRIDFSAAYQTALTNSGAI